MITVLDMKKKPNFSKQSMYKWVDYIEILCLISVNEELSKADIIDRLVDAGVGTKGFLLNEDEDDFYYSSVSDSMELIIDSMINHIKYRSVVFNDDYPFYVDNNTIYRKGSISDGSKVYVFLLIASNCFLIREKNYETTITTDFEILASKAILALLPQGATVKIFGTSDNTNSHYAGSLFDKIVGLAKDLSEKTSTRLLRRDFPQSNTGDGGLDIVGWFPNDSTPAQLVVFAGCACTDNWVTKQNSSSGAVWRGKIDFTVEPINVSFIPFCLRNYDGSFFKNGDEINSILIDRERFLSFLPNKSIYSGYSSSYIIDNFLMERESVI